MNFKPLFGAVLETLILKMRARKPRPVQLWYFFAQSVKDPKPKIIAQKFYRAPEQTKIYKRLYRDLENNKYFKVGFTADLKILY